MGPSSGVRRLLEASTTTMPGIFRISTSGTTISNFTYTTRAPPVGPLQEPMLLYPSYLKRLNNETMQHLWHRASESLRIAERVEIYGYSLPESDLAVRTLFNVLRFRSEADERAIRVHAPSEASQERRRRFLGQQALIDGTRIEDGPADQ